MIGANVLKEHRFSVEYTFDLHQCSDVIYTPQFLEVVVANHIIKRVF